MSPSIGSKVRRKLHQPETRQCLLALHAATNLKDFWKAAHPLLIQLLSISDVGFAISLDDGLPSIAFTKAPMSPEHYKATYVASRILEIETAVPGARAIRMADHDTAYLCHPTKSPGVLPLGRKEWRSLIEQAARIGKPAALPLALFHGGLMAFWRGRRFTHLLLFLRHYSMGEYSDAEMALLEAVHPDLETALRRVLKTERHRGEISALSRSLREVRQPLLVLDWKLRPTFCNPEAVEASRHWNVEKNSPRLKARASTTLPSRIKEACRMLREQTARSSRHNLEVVRRPLTRRHRLSDRGAPEVEIIYFKPANTPVDEGRFIVRFAVARAHGNGGPPAPLDRLTVSEQAVTNLVAAGKSNDQVSTALGLSVHTVRAHLRSIFSKIGVQSRGQLTARLNAGRSAPESFNL